MTRLKGFTIIDIIITLIISTMLIAFLWNGYYFITKQYNNLSNKNSKLADFITLESQLRKDFNNAVRVTYLKEEVNCIGKNQNTLYKLNNKYVIRNQNSRIDTFPIAITDINVQFLNIGSNTVESITLNIDLNSTPISLFFKKTYYPEFFININ